MKRELYPDKNLINEQLKQRRTSNVLTLLGIPFGIAIYFYMTRGLPIQEELVIYSVAIIITVVVIGVLTKTINSNRMHKIGSEYILIRNDQLIYHTAESEKKYNLADIRNFEIIPRTGELFGYLLTNIKSKAKKKDILGVRINFNDGKYLNLLYYNMEELREIFKELNVNKQIFGMLENFYQYNFGDLKNQKNKKDE